MNDGWVCPRCSTENYAASIACWTCGTMRPDGLPVESPTPGTAAPVGLDAAGSDVLQAGSTPPDASAIPVGDGPADPQPASGVPGWVPPDGVPIDQPRPARPLWRRIPLGWLVIGLLVVGSGVVGWYVNASRSSTGEITKSGDLTASDLRVGDCFDLKDPTADTIGDVKAEPCNVEHEFEIFFIGSMPDGAYPANAEFKGYVGDNCDLAFDRYVGKAYLESSLEIYFMVPIEDAWRSGDRSVQCAVYHPIIHRQKQSLKGSRQ